MAKKPLAALRADLKKLANPAKAKILARFFKTGPGEYGEGDIFLGITVPDSRKLVRQYWHLPLSDITELLKSPIHEERLIALLILVAQFPQSPKLIYDTYLKSTKFINNWDLVDLSAPKIVGDYLLSKPNAILFKLAKSKNLWERRIAILSTFAFIYQGNPQPTLRISGLLLGDKEDLIHKAVGWMLREVGKRISQQTLTDFLNLNYRRMPRTMLRYAIERFPEPLRRQYLEGRI